MGSEDTSKTEAPQEEAGWQYKPAGGVATQPSPSVDEPTVAEEPSREVVEWTASEFIEHEKGFGWYLMLTLAAALIAACVYWVTKDVFAATVVVIMITILMVSASRKPRVITYKVDSSGITVAGKFYPYAAYKSFSVPDNGPFVTIELAPLKHLEFPVGAYLSPDSQEDVLEIISQHLPLERDDPSAIDRLLRRLRF